MDTRSISQPDAGLTAWFKARARLRRARELYACGQAISARGGAASSARSARLYRRALELLVPAPQPKTVERQVVRDALRAELGKRGLRGAVRARPREAKLLLWAAALLLLGVWAVRFFAPDRAAGKPWIASSAWGPFPRTGIMQGEAPIDGRFHTVEGEAPWVQIDLGEVFSVHAVRVENRTNCCKERALPLAIELSVDGKNYQLVGYRRVLFDTFTQHFSTRSARYVRLRVDRRSVLHLRRVSVY